MVLRWLLPWVRFSVDTAWAPEEVGRKVEAMVRDGSIDGDPGWRGVRAQDGFRIARGLILSSGIVREAPHGGSRLVVNLRLPAGLWTTRVLLPLVFLLVVATTAFVAILRQEGIVLLLLAVCPFAQPWSTLRRFWGEAREAEASFRRAFPPPVLQERAPFR